jgi:hypothetical protein
LEALFEPLPPTSDDDSPLPSPSELPKYFIRKNAERAAAAQTVNVSTARKAVHLPKILPSGTPIKLESNILSSAQIVPTSSPIKDEPDTQSSQSSDHDLSDLEEMCKNEEHIQIAHLKLQKKEFTHVFPAFPKTHVNGYAYIIKLNDKILNDKDLLNLQDGLQYSLTRGGGPKVHENVKFFACEGEKVPIKIHFRQCAGNFPTQQKPNCM